MGVFTEVDEKVECNWRKGLSLVLFNQKQGDMMNKEVYVSLNKPITCVVSNENTFDWNIIFQSAQRLSFTVKHISMQCRERMRHIIDQNLIKVKSN